MFKELLLACSLASLSTFGVYRYSPNATLHYALDRYDNRYNLYVDEYNESITYDCDLQDYFYSVEQTYVFNGDDEYSDEIDMYTYQNHIDNTYYFKLFALSYAYSYEQKPYYTLNIYIPYLFQ